MLDIKIFFTTLAVILTFIGYFPYIVDTLKGKTKPHIFSWLIWSITTWIIFSLQISSGGGSGSFVTLAVGLVMTLVFCLSLKNGSKEIKKVDIIFLILALTSIPLWVIVKQPVLSIVLLSTIEMLGFLPTIRKSWSNPYSETLSLYVITTFRHGLSVFALAEYNIVTYLFPVTWIFANAIFSIILLTRRKVFGVKHN